MDQEGYRNIKSRTIHRGKPINDSRDFSNYQKIVPGVFLFLGSGNDKKVLFILYTVAYLILTKDFTQGIQLYKNIINRIR